MESGEQDFLVALSGLGSVGADGRRDASRERANSRMGKKDCVPRYGELALPEFFVCVQLLDREGHRVALPIWVKYALQNEMIWKAIKTTTSR